jgi:hypothetical protein
MDGWSVVNLAKPDKYYKDLKQLYVENREQRPIRYRF